MIAISITALGFITKSIRTTTVAFHVINANVSPFDPENWKPLDFIPSEATCAGTGKAHALIILDTDAYPANHPHYPNLPKVDIAGTGSLQEFIINALSTAGDPTTVSNRTLYEGQ